VPNGQARRRRIASNETRRQCSAASIEDVVFFQVVFASPDAEDSTPR